MAPLIRGWASVGRWGRLSVGLFLALQAADCGLTNYAVAAGAEELNPLMAPLIGTLPWVFLKLAVPPLVIVALIAVLGWRCSLLQRRAFCVAIGAATLFLSLVLVSNLMEMGSL